MYKSSFKYSKTLKSLFLGGAFFTVLNFLFTGLPALAATSYPGQILKLTNWKQTLPTGSAEKPLEIKQTSLGTYTNEPYFQVNAAANGVQFRAPVNGVTTSGSGYPRSELREMTNNGKDNASWSTTSGVHSMYIEQAITAVPQVKKHVVAGQIHDANDDVIVIRLEYPKLFVDINGKTGPTLDSNYQLGKKFTVKFVADNGQIKVYYNNSQSPVYSLKKASSGNYFKAGAYTQSNCSKEKVCADNNFGEVVIYKLDVQHLSSNEVPVENSSPVLIAEAEASAPQTAALTMSNATQGQATEYVFEAESAIISGGLHVVDDQNSSGGKYLQADSNGSAIYKINVTSAGKYKIAGWVNAKNTSTDSFYVSMDGKSKSIWSLLISLLPWKFDIFDDKIFTLNPGQHTLELKYREAGAKIDKLILIKQE